MILDMWSPCSYRPLSEQIVSLFAIHRQAIVMIEGQLPSHPGVKDYCELTADFILGVCLFLSPAVVTSSWKSGGKKVSPNNDTMSIT